MFRVEFQWQTGNLVRRVKIWWEWASKKVFSYDVSPESMLLLCENARKQIWGYWSSFRVMANEVNCLVEHYCCTDDGGVWQGSI